MPEHTVVQERAWVPADDGTPIAVTVFRPEIDAPQPCLIEALPYRQDDITSSYGHAYHRLASEFAYAVCRVDVRGTGSSGGIITDEYPDVERDDLRAVFRWLAAQPWCTGRVGMFGTSYSGFNSLTMAAEPGPELGAVFAIYATDDRFTDDVHFAGGQLRAIDLIDYVHYMVPMNALPPTPSVWATSPTGTDWRDEWRRRIDETPPWLFEWLTNQVDAPTWRRSSLRLGPDGAGYERVAVPTMIVAGWADGYRNNTFRTVRHLNVPWRLLAGPWAHQDPARARPGPHLDLDLEMAHWFDEHLRDIVPSEQVAPMQVFVRHSTRPLPDLEMMNGEWVAFTDPDAIETSTFSVSEAGVDELAVVPDAGLAAWITCAGGLPWGQPLDQRSDDERSITYEWPAAEPITLIGNAVVSLRVRSSAPVALLALKLCDVFPDGTSQLVTRGVLNLTHRGVWPGDDDGEVGVQPQPLVPGEWYDVTVELEAMAHQIQAGHTMRLVVAGSDWPNCWTVPEALTLGVDRASVSLVLPRLQPGGTLPEFGPGDGIRASSTEGVTDDIEWRTEHDVLRREVRARTRYGGPYDGNDGAKIVDCYEGEVGVSTTDPGRAWAIGHTSFDITWPEGRCVTDARLELRSDRTHYAVDLRLTATLDGEPLGERHWIESIPRYLQ